jgi:hypothetical protein
MNRRTIVSLGVWAVLAGTLCAQTVPDLLYFRFNEGSGTNATNSAVPGVGTNPAPIVGTLTFGAGQIGGGIVGTGLASSTNYVNTGWVTNLTGSFTLEFWINPSTLDSTLRYVCGDVGGATFRVFSGGVAGTGNLMLRGTATTVGDTVINGCVGTIGVWNHVAWVCDRPNNIIHAYMNGVLVSSIAQPAAAVITGTGPFKVCAQGTSAGLTGSMDEFRLWGTARTGAQILASYNQELFPNNIFTAVTSGGGVGDLSLSLTSISPGAVEGYMLVTSAPIGGVGTGPLFGIWPSGETWALIATPLAVGNPLHFVVGIPGAFPDTGFSVPAGTLSYLAGQTWDLVCVVAGPSLTYLGHSQAQRMGW